MDGFDQSLTPEVPPQAAVPQSMSGVGQSMPSVAPEREVPKGVPLVTVYDPNTRERIDTSHDDAYQGLIMGQYTVPVDSDYDVLKDNGEIGGESYKIKGAELVKALKGGFSFDTPGAKAIRAYKDENSGALGTAKTLALSAANQALLGVPEVAAKLGIGRWLPESIGRAMPTIEEMDALSEIHPTANVIGGVGGAVGSLVAGPAGLVARGASLAGGATERALGKIIAATAGEEVGKRTSLTVAKEIVAKLAGSSVEGAAFMAPQAVTEAVLGDPKAAAESLITGGLIGGVFGGATMLGSKLIKAGSEIMTSEAAHSVTSATKNIAKAGAEVFTGVNKEALEYASKNMAAVEAAKPFEEITDEFIKKVKSIRQEGTAASGESRKILEDANVKLSTEDLSKPFIEAAEKLSSAAKTNPNVGKALDDLAKYGGSLEKIAQEQGGHLTGVQVKDSIGYLDSLVSYDGSKAYGADKFVESTIKNIRRGLDAQIKDAVPEYAAHMAELSESTKIAKDIAGKFRQDKGAENLLKRVMNGKDRFVEENLKKFDTQFGTNFSEDLKNSWAKRAFEKDTTNGSRKTMGYGATGAAIGGSIAGPVGALAGGAIGAVTGMVADKYGTQAVLKGLNILQMADKQITESTGKLKGFGDFIKEMQSGGSVSAKSKGAVLLPLTRFYGGKIEHKSNDEALQDIRKATSEFVSQPELLQKKIDEYTRPLRDGGAPKVADQVSLSMHNTVSYINSVMPKEYAQQSPFAPKLKMRPSHAVMSDFQNKLEVVSNPWAVLSHVKSGTLTKSHVEALKFNYPSLYNYMQIHIQHVAATSQIPLTYQNRVSLGTLFGTPLDESMRPGKLADLQQSFITNDDGSQEKKAELDLASGMSTGTDKFQKS